MIKLKNLTKIYNSGESVGIGIHDVNLEMNIGEFVAIIGSSGSGKTTLINIISGMDTYTEGEMFVNGVSTANFDTNELENYRRGNVAFIFQNYQLIDSYTVLENVMIELIIKGMNKKDAKKKAKELLDKVGMGERLNHRATKLSGGEKQRVVIARALASDAKILACDEPTGNLDTKNTKEIMSIIKEVSKDKLVLFVTHDESLIKDNATRVIKIRDGKIESDTNLVETNKTNVELITPEQNDVKTLLNIAFKNLIRTPKKSLFVMLVFFILSFVILFSIAYIPLEMVATSDVEIEFTMFKNRDENRIVIYNDETFDGNYNIQTENMYQDDYMLDYSFRGTSNSALLNQHLEKTAHLKLTKNDLVLTAGRLPDENSDNEVVVILNDGFSNSFYSSILESETVIKFASDSKTDSFFTDGYKVVGFAKCEKIDTSISNFYTNEKGAKSFIKNFKKRIIKTHDSSNFINDFSFEYNGKTYPVTINNELKDDEIRVSFKYKDEDYKVFLGNIELDISNYNIQYTYEPAQDKHIQLSFLAAINLIENNNYRTSIYVEDDVLDEAINTLRANQSLEVFPLIEAKQIIPQYDFISIFKNLFYFVFIFVEIVASLLIAALITSFILGTKKKELGVLRVIGLSQNDVLLVLNFEVVTIMMISIILNIIAALSFNLFESPFSYNIIFNNGFKLAFSIILLLIMAVYISYRWNKKMFKQTAREVLKAGE